MQAWNLTLVTVFLPLAGALLAGLFGKKIGDKVSSYATIFCLLISCICSFILFYNLEVFNKTLYTWGVVGGYNFQIGFLVDYLTVVMLCVVTFVSLMVHVYSIGYMEGDDGFSRFFAYMSLFTFSMLMLVSANNCLQLFFGWEAVGVVSYLLIGFWYQKESAVFANLKAFLVNRVGDFGFLLGLGATLLLFGSLDYVDIFAKNLDETVFIEILGNNVNLLTVACVGLFIGAMGKSAQMPLHVWLPDSMEGPTPISALIHAATMVTAGIFMVARMSPIFEYSDFTLNLILLIGSITALLMGFLGLVQNDIKRIIAYSTLSQLGYMVTALGVSAYSIAMFHLFTHAFFKALLFLGAGSVIIGMHHEQDIQKMGGLRRYMPVTFWMMVIGSLALTGLPFLSGFYSKDMIIMAVKASELPSSSFAYAVVVFSVLITTLYSFRLLFLVFFTEPRMDAHTKKTIHESPLVVLIPLILLAIPSVIIGFLTIDFFMQPDMNGAILNKHDVMQAINADFDGAVALGMHGVVTLPFFLFVFGVLLSWLLFIKYPNCLNKFSKILWPLKQILILKYGFDIFYQYVFAGGTRAIGWLCWKFADELVIDTVAVNGSAKSIKYMSNLFRRVQSGYIYHYVCIMVIGLLSILIWLLRN